MLEAEPELLEGRLDLGGPPTHFAALNTALFSDGLWIDVPAGMAVQTPIELDHAIPRHPSGVWRTREFSSLLADGAELTLIETYAGEDVGQLTNSVVEVDLGRNAKVSHVRSPRERRLASGPCRRSAGGR